MKLNGDETYELLYTQLESLKERCSKGVTNILCFCQQCICDQTLRFLPDEVELRTDSVIFSYEEDNGDHLMISFKKEGYNFDDPSIDYFSFQNNHLKSINDLSWHQIVEFINKWTSTEL